MQELGASRSFWSAATIASQNPRQRPSADYIPNDPDAGMIHNRSCISRLIQIRGANTMSALGQKRTHALQQRMSALGQKRTCPSFDELVGTREQLRGHDETDSLRSF